MRGACFRSECVRVGPSNTIWIIPRNEYNRIRPNYEGNMLNLPLFQFGHFRFHFVCFYRRFLLFYYFVRNKRTPVDRALRLMLHWWPFSCDSGETSMNCRNIWHPDWDQVRLFFLFISISCFCFLHFERRHWLISLVLSHTAKAEISFYFVFCLLFFFLVLLIPFHMIPFPSNSFVRSVGPLFVWFSPRFWHNSQWFLWNRQNQRNHCFWPLFFDVRFLFGVLIMFRPDSIRLERIQLICDYELCNYFLMSWAIAASVKATNEGIVCRM